MFRKHFNELIDHAIWAHSRWKSRLVQAIESGCCNVNMQDAANPSCCDFGKWLKSPEAHLLEDYTHLVELHRAFHGEVAHILEVAVHGDIIQAKEMMKLGSPFNQLTAQLINCLSHYKKPIVM